MKTYTIEAVERSIKNIKSYPKIQEFEKSNIDAALRTLKEAGALSLLSYDNISSSFRQLIDSDPIRFELALRQFFSVGIWNACVPKDLKLPKQGVVFIYGCGKVEQYVEPKPLVLMPEFSFKKWKLLEVYHLDKSPSGRELYKLELSGHHRYIFLNRVMNSCGVHISSNAPKYPPGPFVPRGVTIH